MYIHVAYAYATTALYTFLGPHIPRFLGFRDTFLGTHTVSGHIPRFPFCNRFLGTSENGTPAVTFLGNTFLGSLDTPGGGCTFLGITFLAFPRNPYRL